jgi:hypothetical protein
MAQKSMNGFFLVVEDLVKDIKLYCSSEKSVLDQYARSSISCANYARDTILEFWETKVKILLNDDLNESEFRLQIKKNDENMMRDLKEVFSQFDKIVASAVKLESQLKKKWVGFSIAAVCASLIAVGGAIALVAIHFTPAILVLLPMDVGIVIVGITTTSAKLTKTFISAAMKASRSLREIRNKRVETESPVCNSLNSDPSTPLKPESNEKIEKWTEPVEFDEQKRKREVSRIEREKKLFTSFFPV